MGVFPPVSGRPFGDSDAKERVKIGEYWYRQEFMCEFVDTDDQLYCTELVDQAVNPELLPLALPRLEASA